MGAPYIFREMRLWEREVKFFKKISVNSFVGDLVERDYLEILQFWGILLFFQSSLTIDCK